MAVPSGLPRPLQELGIPGGRVMWLWKTVSIFATVPLVACSSGYQSRPLPDRQVLVDFELIQLESLQPACPSTSAAEPTKFDASDGLSIDEAVAVGLHLNADLRVFRYERGVAEGELAGGRVLPTWSSACSGCASRDSRRAWRPPASTSGSPGSLRDRASASAPRGPPRPLESSRCARRSRARSGASRRRSGSPTSSWPGSRSACVWPTSR